MQKRNLLLAIISGIVLALAMPRPGIWLFSWVGLVPLFIALRSAKPSRALLYGLVTGVVYFGIVLFWISLFGYLPWVLLVIIEALFIALFALAAQRLMPSRVDWAGYIAVPAAWTVMQWLRSLGVYSFTWGSFAHAQANNLPLIQISSLTGPWGIDFVICLFNLALADFIWPMSEKRRYAPLAAALGVLIIACTYGFISLDSSKHLHPNTKAALIQANIQSDFSAPAGYDLMSYNMHSRLSQKVLKEHPDLLVWAETTIPTQITDTGWGAYLSALARQSHTNLIVGGYDNPSKNVDSPSYNAAFFYDKFGKKLGVYHKVRLVPFGEFVPLRKQLPFLSNYHIRGQDVRAGKSHRLVSTQTGKIGTSICFESLFPQISQCEVKHGANVLLVMTNDSWFKRTPAARGHMMMAKLRAVENHRYLMRAAVTGISAVIDPYGRTVNELGIYKRGIVTGEIAPRHALTLYTRLGDYFAYACAVIVLLMLVIRPSTPKQE